jgi:uncharacterized protein
MSKNKIQDAQPKKKNNLLLQIGTAIVLVALAAYLILPNIINNKETPDNPVEQTMNNKTAYSFTKHGELTFNDSKNTFISKIDIEIANTPEARETGLMFRNKMEMNQGMLFIFPMEEQQAFWMHNTELPLDIIYVNSKMEVVSIAKNAKPFDDTALPSVKPAQYVVEVNAGYCDNNNIKDGSKIVWRRD